MSLPEAWVDRIFAQLAVRYGQAFLGRWTGVDMTLVKADWARELSRFQQAPSAIAFALDNLPAAEPPTVGQFREICARSLRDDRQTPALEHRAKPDPERVKEALQRFHAARSDPSPLAWLHRLRALRDAGQQLSVAQADAVRRMDAAGIGLPPRPIQEFA